MIISMGIDIVEIGEIKTSIERSKRFTERVFTRNEIGYCESKTERYQHYAARFAAKEAVMKALGTGWDKGVQWGQIEIVNGAGKPEAADRSEERQNGVGQEIFGSGKPDIRLYGKALQLIKEVGVDNIFVSLSHSQHYAVASVIFEGDRRLVTGNRIRDKKTTYTN